MAEATELQALDTISSEVDDAQYKVIAATQCIKAQAFLVDKLKKQAQRCKETCESISNANLKLQSEITNAEQEIKSLLISKDTIRMANVELKKEFLVAKEKKLDIIERVKVGEQKYEKMWGECKSRYESLPYVKKLQETAEKAKSLRDQINALDKKAEILAKEIDEKKEACLRIDRERIIQLAEFMVHERPRLIEKANETHKAIIDMSNELKTLNIDFIPEEKVEEIMKETNEGTTIDQNKTVDESALIMPKLKLDSLDLDDLISVKLDQVKMRNVDYTTSFERRESYSKSYFDIGTTKFNKKPEVDESISSYFSKPNDTNKDIQNYSKKKLINILGDVKVDANDAMDILSKVNPENLQTVESISAVTAEDKSRDDSVVKTKVKEPMQCEEIEEIDMTSSNTDSIVKPPTQFLDESLKSQLSQKSQEQKKTVSFDLPSSLQSNAMSGNTNDVVTTAKENEPNETINSQLDVTDADDRFMKTMDMVLKKHNLDLTPPFVYAKNSILQNKAENNVVTSKFFKNDYLATIETNDYQKEKEIKSDVIAEKYETKKVVSVAIEQKENTFCSMMVDDNTKIIELDVDDDIIVSSPKKPKIDGIFKADKPFGGYLFRHGPQGLPESLDLSMSTTGYDDGDVEFSHGIDSSLLLSPKADLPMASDNIEVQSQEAPNFLSGLRKQGLSFFGRLPAGESKTDSSVPNQASGSFNFNFGGEEKKNRGGLFSLFQ